MLSDSDRVVDDLLRWCKAHGIQIDERITVARGDVGICILTQDAFIEHRATLVSIPKSSAILSIRNCLLAEHIPQVIFGSEVLLGLALGLYGEILRGEASPWFGYLQSLPKHVSIALFWDDIGADEDERSASTWLKGTMVERELSVLNKENTYDTEKRPNPTVTELRRYYDLTVFPALIKANLKDLATLEGFKHAYALVSSRAFIVDAYHGLAMVPIADAFNHSSENHVHLESDHEVCRVCGSLTECSHDMEDGDWSERTSSREDRTLNDLEDIEDTCEMVANASVPPFTEVFNTYGECLTNAQLLVRYGFILDGNDNDMISWSLRELLHFTSVIMRNLDEAGERCCDEESSSTDRDIGPEMSREKVTSIEGAAAKASYECQDIPHYLPGEEIAFGTKSADKNDEDQAVKLTLGHILLKRLMEVVDVWTCGASTWESSMLVYFPNGQEKQCIADSYGEDADVRLPSGSKFETDFSEGDGNVEAHSETTYFHARTKADTVESSLLGKRSQLYLALNDEAKISHHLWIFCALLAMHAPQLIPRTSDPCSSASTSSDAELLSKSCSKELFNEPQRREDSEYSTFIHNNAELRSQGLGNTLQSFIEEDIRSSTTHPGLATTAEEDVAILRRIVLVQKVLEDLSQCSGSQMDVDDGDEKGGKTGSRAFHTQRFPIAWNQTFESKIKLAAKGPPGIPTPSLFLPLDAAPEKGALSGNNPRKRTRMNSSASSQSEGTRDHIRLRPTERIVVEGQAQIKKENPHGITDYNVFKTNTASHKELRSDDTRRDQRGIEGGGLSALLDYDDDSDTSQHSDSDPEVHRASAVGGTFRKKYLSNDEASLADMDTRARARHAQKSELENRLPLQEVISVLHDRRTAPYESGLRAGALNSQNVLEGCDSENTPSEASIVHLVALTAHIVARLCAARSCRMFYPSLDAAALGDVVDAIPLEKPLTRMAAQLALAERARLEGCVSVWKELTLLLTRS